MPRSSPNDGRLPETNGEAFDELPESVRLDLTAIGRTYLAYTRTVLAILLLGIAILAFELRESRSLVLSALVGVLFAVGVFAAWFARSRLIRLRGQVQQGVFATDRVGPGILAVLLALLLLASVVLVTR